MGRYAGETYNIPLEQGGFCYNKNIDTIAPVDMVHPSKNVWLNEGGIRKRGGTTPVDTNIMYTIGTPAFYGSGLDDLTAGTVYTYTEAAQYIIQICSTGTPDSFQWYHTGGTLSDPVQITGSAQTLERGFEITFTATTGHTATDYWVINITTPEVTGLFDYTLINGNQFIVRGTSDGKIWKTNATAIKTGLVNNKIVSFIQWEDYIIACNGANKPLYWEGTGGAADFTTGVAAQGTVTISGLPVADETFVVDSQTFTWKDVREKKGEISIGRAAAVGTITMTGLAVADETFVIDDQTFTWKAARSTTGEVRIGGSTASAITNIVAAVNTDLATVSAKDGVGNTAVITAALPGTAGNSIVFTEASSNLTMNGSGTLGGTTAGTQNAAGVVTNIVEALNEDMTTVTAADGAGDTVVVTAATKGTAANSMVFTETSTNMTMNGEGVLGATTAGVKDMLPSDWTGTSYPKQMIIHGRGNSARVWALGCYLKPNTIYVTPNGDPTGFADTEVLTFSIPTENKDGIVGGVEFGDRLLLFGKNRSFLMDDTSVDTDNWGYRASQWSGGAASHRLIIKTPNDVVCMMDNGEIYSVTAAEEYGDYKSASLSRPSFVHEWIKTYINLAYIDDFHGVYDPVLRAINFFMVRIGETEVDTVLMYFIDRPPNKAWVILDNQDYESGYSACSSCLVNQSTGVKKIYTGSFNGRVWKLGETNRNDNSNAFVSTYKTPLLSFDNVREHKRYDRMKIVSIAEGACSAKFTWWIDGVLKNSKDIEFSASGDVLGSFILGTSTLGGLNILESSVNLGYTGKRIQIETKSSTANEDFFLSQFLVDFVPLYKRI